MMYEGRHLHTVDRKALKRRIKRNPRAYSRKRIAQMDSDDVKALLASLARTNGLDPKGIDGTV